MHYAFPQEWGLGQGSRLHEAMKEAITKKLYDVRCYEKEMRNDSPKELLRVELQEFGYWVITTAWDLQTEFGPWKSRNGEYKTEAEWKVRTAAELQEKLPLSHALYVDTVAKTLVAPRAESLRALAAFEPQSGAASQPSQGSGYGGGAPIILI